MNAIATSHIADAQMALAANFARSFTIAGVSVELRGDTLDSVNLGPQLEPFATANNLPDIRVQIEWSSTITPSRSREIFHSGCLWSVHQAADVLLFDFVTQRFGSNPYKRMIVDQDFQQARVILNRECLTADDAGRALEYPLDELLITHHLSLGRGVELHACGLVCDGTAVLFAGHSGAGKSTTARLWSDHVSVEVLSDDRIIVRKYGSQFFMHGTPWHGEAAFATPGRAPIQRIFLLEHGPANRIERLSPSAAVGELLARSFTPFYQPRFVNPVLALLDDLAASLPCYRFHFVPDHSAVERILAFRD
jgi:hypothetical protein